PASLYPRVIRVDSASRRRHRLRRGEHRRHRALETPALSNLAVGTLGVVALLAVLLLRGPIRLALALVGVCGYAAIDGWRKALVMMASVPFELASAYSLSVVPLFILMGAVA